MTRAITEAQRLLQEDVIEEMQPSIGTLPWQTLYDINDQSVHRFDQYARWCALLNDEAAAVAIQRDQWDHTWNEYRPQDREAGVTPLVFIYSHSGTSLKHLEINQEFRLFHNLTENQDRSVLLSFDEDGRRDEVVRITSKQVQVQTPYILSFLAESRLTLALYVESTRHTDLPLSSVVPQLDPIQCQATELSRWRRTIASSGSGSFSRLQAKVLIPPSFQETIAD